MLYHVEFYQWDRAWGGVPMLVHNGIMTPDEALEIAQGNSVILVRKAGADEARCGYDGSEFEGGHDATE